jgi:hypothetical protein
MDVFFGVYSPKGELEAVESTMSAAKEAAFNLSPGQGASKGVNRTVRPVLVLPYGSADELEQAFRDALDRVRRQPR